MSVLKLNCARFDEQI